MTQGNPIDEIVKRVTGKAVDHGRLIELGFASLLQTAYPDWEAMPRAQLEQLRETFFAGAQHLFSSIITMLDPGTEPTVKDEDRMQLIDGELREFVADYSRRHSVPRARA